MTVSEYIANINQRYKLGNSTEHTFRGDLQQLIENLVPGVQATNEPKRQACGAPDYILTKNEIPIGFIEAKNIGDSDLIGKKKSGNKEQFDRYKASLNNLIFTDYINFLVFQDGELTSEISIAEFVQVPSKESELFRTEVLPQQQNFARFENLIKDFCTHISQNIKSSKKLAEMMAGKARLLSDVIEKALISDESLEENSTLKEQMSAFKSILIHDITPKRFADVYAQTIAYGMFAARLHDPTLDTFSRQEAAELIPKSNPFLRKLFGYIAGPDIDDRIKWIVENLTEIFLACNVEKILKDYGKTTQMEDPIIHFYETFLAEYDPKLRKSRGVWYTPAPVVSFIVRAVDDILKNEFDLPQGLADTSKTEISVKTDKVNKNFKSGYKEVKQKVHRVQILDPATGTATFLSEIIKHINKKFKGQEGIWSSYVEDHLLPRLNGFEILMASYAMAHLQLDLLLKETGFRPIKNQRTKVYLTNSLEEYHPDTGTLWANALANEANEANYIKRDSPVMCILGNPPYSVSSSNKGEWIENLLVDYKKDLAEKSYNSLSDDYIKFIRYGQYYVEKNGTGILAFITNNSFVSGVVHRQMRKSLVTTFDDIYIINLHGSSKTNETSPDGSIDENVFDIQQGVSINIFIKKDKGSKANATVKYCDLWGKRKSKYKKLSESSLADLETEILNVKKPNYYFQPIDEKLKLKFDEGISLVELFIKYSSGVQTEFDVVAIQKDKNESERVKEDIDSLTVDELLHKYKLPGKSKIKLIKAKEDLKNNETTIYPLQYRPFEYRSVLYTGFSNGIMGRPRKALMQHMYKGENIALVIKRARLLGKETQYNHCFISKNMIDKNFLSDQSYCLPLYIYSENTLEGTLEKIPNLNMEIVEELERRIGIHYFKENELKKDGFSAEDVMNYIYGVLHSLRFRKTYNEFLKIDFPKIPYPKNIKSFWNFVKAGKELRKIHLLESPTAEVLITSYPKDGSNTITSKIAKSDWELIDKKIGLGRIWINEEQYFDKIPQTAWEFHIGGYQPAQKWLKERRGKTLSFDDILHYQKIIVALEETNNTMIEISKIEI